MPPDYTNATDVANITRVHTALHPNTVIRTKFMDPSTYVDPHSNTALLALRTTLTADPTTGEIADLDVDLATTPSPAFQRMKAAIAKADRARRFR